MVDKGVVGWAGMSPWASDSRPFDEELYDRDEWQRNIAKNTEYLNDPMCLDIFMDESLDIFHILHEMGAQETKPIERGSVVFRRELEKADVTLVERTMITGLVQDERGRVAGAVGFTYDDSKEACKAVVLSAKAVILCTGAGSYKSPGFPIWGQTFDGDAIAYEAGAKIIGKEFHDTHSTFAFAPAAAYEGWHWAQSVTGAYVMVGPPGSSGGLSLEGALGVFKEGISRNPGGMPGGAPPAADALEEQLAANRKLLGRGYLKTPGLNVDVGAPSEGIGGPTQLGYRVGGSTAGMGVHKSEGVFCSDYSCAADGVEGLYAAGDALGSMLCGSLYPGRGFSSYGSAIQGRRAAKFASDYLEKAPAPGVIDDAIKVLLEKMWAPREQAQGYSPEWLTATLQKHHDPISRSLYQGITKAGWCAGKYRIPSPALPA